MIKAIPFLALALVVIVMIKLDSTKSVVQQKIAEGHSTSVRSTPILIPMVHQIYGAAYSEKGIASVKCFNRATKLDVPTTGKNVWTANVTLAAGNNEVVCTATDTAGETSDTAYHITSYPHAQRYDPESPILTQAPE